MIGRPEVDPRTCEPTRGVVMLHILKHEHAERQSHVASFTRGEGFFENSLSSDPTDWSCLTLAEPRDALARNDRDVLSARAHGLGLSPPTHRRGEVMSTNAFRPASRDDTP